jgi:hypothetical protein
MPETPGDTYTPAATATSGLTVTISLDATSNACSLVGGLVTFTSAGTCVLDANQPGDGSYSAAAQVQQSIPVAASPNTITFTTSPATVPEHVGDTYTPTATASSGLPVTLSLDLSSTGCSFSAGLVTFTAPGTCVIDANQGGNATYVAATQMQQSIPIAKGSQTITFTSTAPTPGTVGDQYSVTATASSGLLVSFSADPASVGCTVVGSTVTFTAPGTCVIDANQTGSTQYDPAPTAQQTVVVKTPQTITFTSVPPSPGVVGTTYHVTATSDSGLLVAFALDPTSTGCTFAGGVATFTAVGTCIIDATQGGDTTYAPAKPKSQSISVTVGGQTIAFTSLAPIPGFVGTTYHAMATATSGLPVTFSRDPVSSAGCTVGAGGLVTFTSVGICVIDANQAGNASYAPAPQVTQPVPVAPGPQTISFTSTGPTPGIVGTTYTPTATAISGLTVSIHIVANPVCSISGGGVVTFNAAGTCAILADQAGSPNWQPAPTAEQDVTVKLPQTITFTSTAPASPVAGQTYTPTATATSTLPVTFSVSGGCTISGGIVTFTKSGGCTIYGNQAGNGTYAPAPQVQQATSLKKAQTIRFTSSPPNPGLVGATYRVYATSSSGLVVTLSRDAASTGCNFSAGIVTFTGVGTCLIDGNQAGNTTYAPAAQVQQTIVIKKKQTISFTTAAPAAHVGGTYTPQAVSTSGLTVVLTLSPASTACSLSGGMVTYVRVGTCVILANQPGNANWAAAFQVQQSITVRR